ncbi:MAG: pantothenate kinase [Pseudomonas sp.]|uniref:pantothenate kinase n=1 Tax=Pseudomonadaceae TaxID=135621 RepID=UPI0030017D2B
MILELDCGNSFIKWRLVNKGGLKAEHVGVVGSDAELLQAVGDTGQDVQACRLVSVRSDVETDQLVASLAERFNVQCSRAQSVHSLAGVRNGYEDYQRLGLDRWLALVGAYALSGGQSCLVLDLGTAVTSDLVTREGEHLGGYICPGMPLMRNQLCTHTRRIRYDQPTAEEARHSFAPGKSTAEAVERGCSIMLRGFVQAQLDMAGEYLGADFAVFITGGDASLVEEMLPQARIVPDLVFIGLAAACPLN